MHLPELSAEQAAVVAAIEGTREHIFVTGRAGTGKSTLLEYLSWHSSKQLAICAPTGVAALNVGGQTIHSLFRLPIGVIADHPIGALDKAFATLGKRVGRLFRGRRGPMRDVLSAG